MHEHDSNGFYELGRKRLFFAILITFTGSLLEMWGSAVSHSVALWGDAWHMLADSSALVFSLVAIWLIKKYPNAKHFGEHHLAEVVASVINCLFIFTIAISIFVRVAGRLNSDYEVAGGLMLVVSIVGLAANGVSAWLLWQPGKKSLNIKGAFLHVVSDSLCSVAVILGALMIYLTHLKWLDTLVGAAIGAVILLIGLNLARKLARILG